jgi:hypothetical protein
MNKTTFILSVVGLALGFALYYTGWLNPVIKAVQTTVMPHITNFLGFLKANPLASTVLGSLTGGGVLAVTKSVMTAQKESAVQAVQVQSQSQLNVLSNQLFQSNKAQTTSEQTIAALQQQVTDLKAQIANGTDNTALLEAQQLLVQKNSELERLRTDYNSLQRIAAESKVILKEIVK